MESMGCWVFCWEKKCNSYWNQATASSSSSPLWTKMSPFPQLWLAWNENEKHILVSDQFVGLSVSAARSCYGKKIQTISWRISLIQFPHSFNQDHMRFHWSVLSDHSTLMAFNSPSERLTRTQDSSADPFRETPQCLLLSWLHLLLRLTLYTLRWRQGHQEAFLWCQSFHVTLVTQSLHAVITPLMRETYAWYSHG